MDASIDCFPLSHDTIFPRLTQPLFTYQEHITDLASMYNFLSIIAYDQSFRLALAANQRLSWSDINEQALNRHIRTATALIACFNCQATGQTSQICQLRTRSQHASNNFSSFSKGTAAHNRSTVPPFRAPGVDAQHHFHSRSPIADHKPVVRAIRDNKTIDHQNHVAFVTKDIAIAQQINAHIPISAVSVWSTLCT